MSFDWQTEDDHWPDEVEQSPVPAGPQENGRRLWPFIVLALLGLGVAGWLVYGRVQQQVSATTANVEADVVAAHRLLMDAAQREDVELFRAGLSGLDPEWTAVQAQWVEDGRLFDRSGLGFTQPVAVSEALTTTIAPDLTAAELLFERQYDVTMPDGLTQTVTLQQTAVYRLGSGKWLYAPPERDFWGDWFSYRGDTVSITYPLRDESLALQLANRLDGLLADVCSDLDVRCPADLRVMIRFETDADSLDQSAEWRETVQSGLRLRLPTPTLVGLPADDAAADALYRGYTTQVATAVIADLTAYDCCLRAAYFSALLDAQLSALGLQPAVVVDETAVLENWWSPTLSSVWNQRNPDAVSDDVRRQIALLLDYVQETTPISPAEMQRRLSDHNLYADWLRDAAGGVTIELLYAQMLQNISRQGEAQTPPPQPLPDASVQMICESVFTDGVYRYDPQSETWTTLISREFEQPRFGYIQAAAPDLFILTHFDVLDDDDEFRVRSAVWRDGDVITTLERTVSNNNNYFIRSADPSRRYLVGIQAGDLMRDYELIDLADCADGQCAVQPLVGAPTWSPNGRFTLVVQDTPTEDTERPPIYLGDATGQSLQFVAEGGNVIWLDDERFLFLRAGPGNPPPLTLETAVAADVTDTTVLLTADDLRDAIPEPRRPQRVWFNVIALEPDDDGRARLLLTANALGPDSASSRGREWNFLATLTPAGTAVAELELVREVDEDAGVRPSPDGRWLAYYTFPRTRDASFDVTLVNTETDAEEILRMQGFAFGWSADGEWLAYNQENRLILTLPGTDYRHVAFHSFEDCYQLSWQETP